MCKRYFEFFLVAGLLSFSSLVGAEISVTIDRKPVHANESFQLFFEADEKPDGVPDFSPLQKDFTLFNSSQSNSISIVNGEYKRSIKWTLQLIPKEAGQFAVPAIQFGNDQSNSFKIEVKPASEISTIDEEDLIFQLSADKATIPVQGQVVVTLRLLTNLNIAAYQMHDLEIEGAEVVIEPLGRARQYQTRLGDNTYLVREKKFALFPQQDGAIKIKPVLAEVQLASLSQSLFNPFPESSNIRRVRSQGLTLEVTPVAKNFDAPQWLPASNIRLIEDWQGNLNQIIAGEPVTRTISLVAEGLTAAQLPDLTSLDIVGVKQYPDKPLLQDQRTSEGIVGTREQKIALIPTAQGTFNLPEISVPWWNVGTGKREIARLPARTIDVKPAANSSIVLPQYLDPMPFKPAESVEPLIPESESNSFWIWLSLILALGWLVSILFWWVTRKGFIHRESVSPDATATGFRQAKRRLKQACKNNNAQEAREALLSWATCIDASRQFIRLSQIVAYFGEPLKETINALNRCLYSQNAIDWQGQNLWEACESITPTVNQSKTSDMNNRLQPLNP